MVQRNWYFWVQLVKRIYNKVDKRVYYRLQLVDLDGSRRLSEVKTLEKGRKEKSLTVHPNPTHDFLNISFVGEADEFLTIVLTDLNGKVVLESKGEAVNGILDTRLSISHFANGVYMLRIKDEFGKDLFLEKINKQQH